MHCKSIFMRTFVLLICAFTPLLAAHAKSPKENNPTPPFPKVVFQTSLGAFTIQLYPKEAPKTVENFLQYVDEGFYVGTIFHRVVPGFVVQAGGITYDFQAKKTREPVINEANNGLLNFETTLSMARTSDPNSASSQFFINLKHNDSLDYKKDESDGYAVFAKVIEGFEVVKKIEKEPRGLYRSRPDAPNYPVIIEAAQRLPAE